MSDMSLSAPVAPLQRRRGQSMALVAGMALALTALADFLLFERPTEIGYGLLALAVGLGVWLLNPGRAARLVWRLAALVAVVAPLAENLSPLSPAVSGMGLAAFALACAGRLSGGFGARFAQAAMLLGSAPVRLARDWTWMRRARRRLHDVSAGRWLVWAMPIAVGLVFMFLFTLANPVVDHWLGSIDFAALFGEIFSARAVFWIVVAELVWAFLRPRLPRRRVKAQLIGPTLPKADVTQSSMWQTLFGRAALTRALVLFNLIFAAQTLMDVAYLWGGAALPDGLTYAEYAHRGAYPLILTALLAACFVLLALKPDGEMQKNRLIRWLVYLWIGQNVALTISSILRLDLYVEIYSLTYWRVAAFLWMCLVGVGLSLIVARIRLQRSNLWLTSANLAALSGLAYICCFVNFAGLIADYNVNQARQRIDGPQYLDLDYLRALGPSALPALAKLAAPGAMCAQSGVQPTACAGYFDREDLRNVVNQRGARFAADMEDWRWRTMRNLRLQRQLAALLPLK